MTTTVIQTKQTDLDEKCINRVFVSFQLAASVGRRHSRQADVVDEKLIESADGRGSRYS